MARLLHDKSPKARSAPPALRPKGNEPLTPEAAKLRALGALGACGIYTLAAKVAGVSRQTLYNWRGEDARFNADCDEAVELAVGRVEQALYARAVLGEAPQIFFYLKNVAPQRWRDRREIEVSIPDIPNRLREAAERARGRLLSVVKAEAVTCEIVPFVPGPIGGNGGNGHG